jgi:5'-phosphate synthase pdxT subunit
MKIGVLALQGAFIEHMSVIRQLGEEAVPVRLPRELDGLGGLIIPGGESTSILHLMRSYNLIEPLRKVARSGFPVLGTCAGMICLAKEVSNSDSSNLETLALMDVKVRRNAFGRQVDSFETELLVPALDDEPFAAVFIRAPVIEEAGPQVEVLSSLPEGAAVAVRQGNLVATAFHPELSNDSRFHSYFLKIVASK